MAKKTKQKQPPIPKVKVSNNDNNVIKVNATFETLVNALANPKIKNAKEFGRVKKIPAGGSGTKLPVAAKPR